MQNYICLILSFGVLNLAIRVCLYRLPILPFGKILQYFYRKINNFYRTVKNTYLETIFTAKFPLREIFPALVLLLSFV